jgi:hypothetical protein
MANSKRTTGNTTPSTTIDPTVIQLSAEQFDHFTEGDGLFIRDEGGHNLAFAHIDNLQGTLEMNAHKEAIREVQAQLELLNMTLFQGHDYLELNCTAQEGLRSLFENMQNKLTRYAI